MLISIIAGNDTQVNNIDGQVTDMDEQCLTSNLLSSKSFKRHCNVVITEVMDICFCFSQEKIYFPGRRE